MTCRHRQPLTHPPSTLQRPRQDPGFASTSPVRHAPHFASTLGESRRALDTIVTRLPSSCKECSAPASLAATGRFRSMKITKLETFHVQPRWLMVKVSTDKGLVGFGEPVVEGRARTVETAVHELSDY